MYECDIDTEYVCLIIEENKEEKSNKKVRMLLCFKHLKVKVNFCISLLLDSELMNVNSGRDGSFCAKSGFVESH